MNAERITVRTPCCGAEVSLADEARERVGAPRRSDRSHEIWSFKCPTCDERLGVAFALRHRRVMVGNHWNTITTTYGAPLWLKPKAKVAR